MKEINALDFNQRPLFFKGLNKIWKSSYALGTAVSLDKDQLIKAARNRTGLMDLGDDFWAEPLEVLLRSINEEARLHPFGRFITKQRLINLLVVRLKAEWWFKKHPEILEQVLYPIYLIAGLQRTGTTKLQRLLSADPETRPLLSWEALNPAPLRSDFRKRETRIRAAKTAEQALQMMAPGFFAIHPVEHLSPEEDILLLDVSFMSTTAEATMHVPTYASWLEQNDQSVAYNYAAKLLKLLQWQRPGKRWVLKSPHHLEFFDLVKKAYGEVHFIWTHRDVSQCLPSFLSMVAHGRAIFSDDVRVEELTTHWLRKIQYMLQQAMAFRRQVGNEELFTDVEYASFIDNPLATVRRIYQQVGPIDEELIQRFKSYESNSQPAKYGRHKYQLQDFNLDLKTIDAYTNRYRIFLESLEIK